MRDVAGELAELAIARGLVSRDEVDEAFEAVAVFGGGFDTNLLEVSAMSERELTMLLEQLHGMKNRIDVSVHADEDAIKLLRRAVAEKTRVVPARISGRTLEVITADPRDVMTLDEVGFATGCKIAPNVACDARIAWHLEHAYGVTMPLRMARIMNDDGWRPERGRNPPRMSGAYSVIRPAAPREPLELDAERDMIDMPDSLLPVAAELAGPPSLTPRPMLAAALETPAPAEAIPEEFEVDIDTPPVALPAAPRRVDVSDLLPPLKPPAPTLIAAPPAAPEAEYAGEIWTGADSLDAAFAKISKRDDLPPLLLSYLIHRLERMVIFAVQRGACTGWEARGARLRRETVETISFSLRLPSIMASVCASGEPFLGVLPFDDVEQGLMVKLSGRWPEHVLLWPIRVSGKTVALLYGEARTALDLSIARELALQIIPRVEHTFLKLILMRREQR